MIKTAFPYRTSRTQVILRRSHELPSFERGVGSSVRHDQGAVCWYIWRPGQDWRADTKSNTPRANPSGSRRERKAL